MTEPTITQADAIKFLENACRNWQHLGPLCEDDIADVTGALKHFAARHREASTAELRAENERLREEIALLTSLPDDIAETVLKIGLVEWGQTEAKDAEGHGASVKNSVELTAAHFQQEGPQTMNGLYLVGEDIVVCHTGTSPNSAQVARALTGAWNLMHDHARAARKALGGQHEA